MPSTARTAAFVVVSAALIALALIFAPAGSDSTPAPASSARPALATPDSGLIARAGRRQAQLHKAATAFIAAYLRYEVGDFPPSVARALRRLATADIAVVLLDVVDVHDSDLVISGGVCDPLVDVGGPVDGWHCGGTDDFGTWLRLPTEHGGDSTRWVFCLAQHVGCVG